MFSSSWDGVFDGEADLEESVRAENEEEEERFVLIIVYAVFIWKLFVFSSFNVFR